MPSVAADETLSSRVYTIVRQRIISGSLTPGQPLSRRTIADEMRTSLLPVAEALQRLEFEGLLESRPRAGTRVRVPTREDVRGHFVVREALEVHAAVLATTEASDQQFAQLQILAARVEELRASLDRSQYAAIHYAFHRRIAGYSRCQALLLALDHNHAIATLWLCHGTRMLETQPGHSHDELAKAIASRDPMVAAEAVRQHVAVGLAHAMRTLVPYFPLRAPGLRFKRQLD
jgi:DNA-binding GntR family transcriptional regulator